MIKQSLQNRPLMCACLSFLIVSVVAVYLPASVKAVLSLCLLLPGLANATLLGRRLFPIKEIRRAVTAVLLCASVAGGLSYYAFDLKAERFNQLAESEDSVTVTVTDTVYLSAYSARYDATVTDSALSDQEFRILLDSADPSLLPGDVLTGSIIYHSLEENAGDFNERKYALTQRIFLSAEDVSLQYTGQKDTFSPALWFRQLNSALCDKIEQAVGEDGGLAAALLLGDRSGLSDTMNRDFRRLGIFHMLSLSGAHLAVLSVLVERLLIKLKCKRRIRALITIAAVLFFMALTGFSNALTRAGIMLILTNIAFLIGRKSDPQTALTLGCAVIVAVNPYAAMDWGLHLSFIAAQSCEISAALGHRMASRFTIKGSSLPKGLRRLCNRFTRYITSSLFFTMVITINMLPLTWLYFDELSLFALPANLIYMPLITLLMYVTVAFLLLSPIPIFAVPLAAILRGITVLIGESAAWLSSLSGIVISLNHWFAPLFLIPIFLLTILSFGCNKRMLRRVMGVNLGLCLCFLAVCGISTLAERSHSFAEYVTEGKNDGILVKSEGKLLICEISTGSYTFASTLANHSNDLRCTEIEAYLLTHYHNRHISALDRLTDCYIVRSLVLPEPISETDFAVYEKIAAMAAEKGIDLCLIERNPTVPLPFGAAKVSLYPCTLLSRSTHPIIALEICGIDCSLMYLGGSYNEGDARITADAEDAAYLIFGGHSPVYKKAFDLEELSKSKTVYLSDYVRSDLAKLTAAEAKIADTAVALSPEELLPLSP